jgi:RP/EB family microtubule-associated protein
VRLDKVNFDASQELDYAKNYRVLQDAFEKLGIDKRVDVDRLIKGKYQDNLEFVQWIKRYYDVHASPGEPYDGAARREAAKKAAAAARRAAVTAVASSRGKIAEVKPARRKPAMSAAMPAPPTNKSTTASVASARPLGLAAGARRASPASASTTAKLERQVSELKNDIIDLQVSDCLLCECVTVSDGRRLSTR